MFGPVSTMTAWVVEFRKRSLGTKRSAAAQFQLLDYRVAAGNDFDVGGVVKLGRQ